MARQVGTFSAEGAFHITGRGWVVSGSLEGTVRAGNQLAFTNDAVLHVVGVSVATTHEAATKVGLLVSEPFTSRQELVARGLLEATARVLE